MLRLALRSSPVVAVVLPGRSLFCEEKKWESYYCIEKTLGAGTFATVYEASDRGTGEKIALKKVRLDDGCVRREIAALTRIRERGNHPNVAAVKNSNVNGDGSWLATELVDGCELFDFLVRRGAFTEKTAADCFVGVFSAIGALHKWGVTHADVKPENLVLTGDFQTVKVVDFGSALLDNQGPRLEDAFRYGTPFYSPPELLEAKLERSSEKAINSFKPPCDAWALGVVLYIALLGCHPFDPDNDLETEDDFARAVAAAFVNEEEPCAPLLKAKNLLSPAAFDLLNGLLQKDPSKRIDLESCLSHPWFNGAAGSDVALDQLAKNLAKWRRFKQRLQATALDTLVARAERRNTFSHLAHQKQHHSFDKDETTTSEEKNVFASDDSSKNNFEVSHFDEALTGILDAVLLESSSEEEQKKTKTVVSEVLSSLRTLQLGKGETVFEHGDDASTEAAEMFFIHSGEVAVLRHGTRVATLKEGEFFGEGSIVALGRTKRSATVTVTKDAKLVAIARRDVQRLSLDARSADNKLRAVAFERALENTKKALSAARSAKRLFLKCGQPACEQGDPGDSLFSIEDGTFDVIRSGDTIATLTQGDFFGEVSILDRAPRNAAVICAHHDGCVLHELASKTFLSLLKRDPRADQAVKSLLMKRRVNNNNNHQSLV